MSNEFAGIDWMQRLADSHGTHTVTAAEETAEEVDIDTSVTGATAFLVQIYRAGVNVSADAVVTLADGILNVTDGAVTYDVTEDDVIMWRVW